jgi:hypothetical protein
MSPKLLRVRHVVARPQCSLNVCQAATRNYTLDLRLARWLDIWHKDCTFDTLAARLLNWLYNWHDGYTAGMLTARLHTCCSSGTA